MDPAGEKEHIAQQFKKTKLDIIYKVLEL